MNSRLVLVPLGSGLAPLVTWLAGQLAEVFEPEVVVGQMIPLPQGGYDARRGQYRGDAFIEALRELAYPEAGRVLGLTDVDCYAPGLNFIFGQATMAGREAFVALPRLRPSFYGLPDDPKCFYQRVLTEAVHELGHTWGLSHCADHHCVMYFSNTLHNTDVKGSSFCGRCQHRLNTISQG